MSQTNTAVVPKIDHAYWFAYSETLLNTAQKRREEAAAAIQKLVVWLWGIYTVSATVGFTLSGKALTFWPTIIIAAASGVLILVYWGTVWVQVPVLIEFDPRSPDEIKSAYSKIVEKKTKRLKITLILSVIAAILVSVALVVASVSKPVKHDFSDIKARVDYLNGKSVVLVTAWVGETERVSVSGTQLIENDKKGNTVNAVILPTKEGLLQTSLEVSNKPIKQLLLELQWKTRSGNDITIAKKIK